MTRKPGVRLGAGVESLEVKMHHNVGFCVKINSRLFSLEICDFQLTEMFFFFFYILSIFLKKNSSKFPCWQQTATGGQMMENKTKLPRKENPFSDFFSFFFNIVLNEKMDLIWIHGSTPPPGFHREEKNIEEPWLGAVRRRQSPCGRAAEVEGGSGH